MDRFIKDLKTAMDDAHAKKFRIEQKEDSTRMLRKQIEDVDKENEELKKRCTAGKLQLEKQEAMYSCGRLNQEKLQNEVDTVTKKLNRMMEKCSQWEENQKHMHQFYEDKLKLLEKYRADYSKKFSENSSTVRALLELNDKISTLENSIGLNQELIAAERKKLADKSRVESQYFAAFKRKCVAVGEELATINKLTATKKIAIEKDPRKLMPPPQALPITKLGRRDFRAQLQAINDAEKSARLALRESKKRPTINVHRRQPLELNTIANLPKQQAEQSKETPETVRTTDSLGLHGGSDNILGDKEKNNGGGNSSQQSQGTPPNMDSFEFNRDCNTSIGDSQSNNDGSLSKQQPEQSKNPTQRLGSNTSFGFGFGDNNAGPSVAQESSIGSLSKQPSEQSKETPAGLDSGFLGLNFGGNDAVLGDTEEANGSGSLSKKQSEKSKEKPDQPNSNIFGLGLDFGGNDSVLGDSQDNNGDLFSFGNFSSPANSDTNPSAGFFF